MLAEPVPQLEFRHALLYHCTRNLARALAVSDKPASLNTLAMEAKHDLMLDTKLLKGLPQSARVMERNIPKGWLANWRL